MVFAASVPGRDRIAIATSIALHCCVLAALVTLPQPSLPTDEPDERTLFSHLIRVEHRPPPARAPVRVARTAEQAAPLPVVHAAVTREHAARKLVVAEEQRAGVAAPVATTAPRVAPAVVARIAAVPAVEPSATPLPTPTPTAVPTPVVATRDDGVGNFGETYPASLDPAVRGTLLAGATGVVVRVAVDEDGHATSIDFVRAPADPAQREELRTRLLTAHFTPAACNGLRCAGTVTLRG